MTVIEFPDRGKEERIKVREVEEKNNQYCSNCGSKNDFKSNTQCLECGMMNPDIFTQCPNCSARNKGPICNECGKEK